MIHKILIHLGLVSPFIETVYNKPVAHKYTLSILGYSIPCSTDQEFDERDKCTVYAKMEVVPKSLVKKLHHISGTTPVPGTEVFVFDNAKRKDLTEA